MAFGRLHVITDTRGGRDPRPAVVAALDAGASVIQVRAKGLSDRALFGLAEDVVRRCEGYGALCIVNDRVDVALAVHAGGVHVGADDLPVDVARRVLGDGRALGATARDAGTARRLEAAGATYLGVGPAYVSTTKDGLPAPLGPEGVARIAAVVSIPVIAVAGIAPRHIPELLAAGAYGVGVISAVSEAADPGAATKELLSVLEAAG